MQKIKGSEFFTVLTSLFESTQSLTQKYAALRRVLDEAATYLTNDSSITFLRLFDRLTYLKQQLNLPNGLFHQLTAFRMRVNHLQHQGTIPTEAECLHDIRSLSLFIAHAFHLPVPVELESRTRTIEKLATPAREKGETKACIRLVVTQLDEAFLYGYDTENPTEEPLKIALHTAQNDAFSTSMRYVWIGAAVNLIDATLNEQHVWEPQLLIIEPDYLVDISAIAELHKEYGVHPYSYFKTKLEKTPTSTPLLLGNMANLFLDEVLNEQADQPVEFEQAARKAFQSMPLEYAAFADLTAFFEQAKQQFQTIQHAVRTQLPLWQIEAEKAILEPSFLCEELGIQGRLDFLMLDQDAKKNVVIELKSGKAAFPDSNPKLIKPNHRTQTALYQYVIQRILGVRYTDIETLLFYSKYKDTRLNFRAVNTTLTQIKQALNWRNILVALERNIAFETDFTQAKRILDELVADKMYAVNAGNARYFENYIRPDFDAFQAVWQKASALEQSYFLHLWQFTALEHWLAKLQVRSADELRAGSLWRDFAGKKANGDILYDLQFTEGGNRCDNASEPTLTFQIPTYDDDFLPNFRTGDLVVVYPRNSINDFSTTQQVFKGSVQSISADEVCVRLTYRQRNARVLPLLSNYAIEHDAIDASHTAIYRSLFTFLQATPARKALLLHQRPPERDIQRKRNGSYLNAQIDEIVEKAKQANDYFLLVGPPGTGKTSVALKALVEEFYSDPTCSILLLAYTNRAVDEICDALAHAAGTPDYIRIGSENACDPKFRPKLLKNAIAKAKSRDEVKAVLTACRIFVGTVATFSNRQDLFKFKSFDVAIIDEASQLLEGNLLGLLSEKSTVVAGKSQQAIGKFILIGDHKQLPAVVLQSEKDSLVHDSLLKNIGLTDRRNSLFERLYAAHRNEENSPYCALLHRQGRMHPAIADLPNQLFYNGQLEIVPTAHQQEELPYIHFDKTQALEVLVATKRMAFIPSEAQLARKTNADEAKITARLVATLYRLYQRNDLPFRADQSIGIIAPFRSQIALIRREIQLLDIPELCDISIDTVERYQGSQRDVIVYSFTMNHVQQLEQLANVLNEDEQLIDRKLNVALTRAKKQLFITGCPTVLSNNAIYHRLLEYIRLKGGYIATHPSLFDAGHFEIPPATCSVPTEAVHQVELPESVAKAFNEIIIQPLLQDHRTLDPYTLLGQSAAVHQLRTLQFGRSTVEHASHLFTPIDRAHLQQYYYFPKQYAAASALYTTYFAFFEKRWRETNQQLMFVDLSSNTLAAGLAFENAIREQHADFSMRYIGIQANESMRKLEAEFISKSVFAPATSVQLFENWNAIDQVIWQDWFSTPQTVILHLGQAFGQRTFVEAENLALDLQQLRKQHPQNQYVLVIQHPSNERELRSYLAFKARSSDWNLIVSPHRSTLSIQAEDRDPYDCQLEITSEIAISHL